MWIAIIFAILGMIIICSAATGSGPSNSEWNTRAVHKCGWHTYAPFGDLFHVHHSCCSYCGGEKPKWGSYHKDWRILTMRRKDGEWYWKDGDAEVLFNPLAFPWLTRKRDPGAY